jgi:hypothetical protein
MTFLATLGSAREPNGAELFTHWVPEAVAIDPSRRERLGATPHDLEFTLEGEGGGVFGVHIADGAVRGSVGALEHADLPVRLDVATWRALSSARPPSR